MPGTRVFDFDQAIVREPGHSVVQGLRDDPSAEPSYDGVVKEHRAYVAALKSAGVHVDVLPALEAFPDSVFVEDPALTFPEGAIVLRPGAETRLRESDEMRAPLGRHFARVLELDGDEYADGGDVMVTPETVLIGLSKRTTRKGAEALRAKLDMFGRKSRIVETTTGALHFKTAASLLDENVVLMTAAMAQSGIFSGLDGVVTPTGEEAAANSLRVNEVVFVGDRFPQTIDLLRGKGFTVVALPVTEINKLDAGLSCMSLRWRKQA